MNDTEVGKTASDSGINAKTTNSAIRVLASLANTYNFPVIFTNHVYANIGDTYGKPIIANGFKVIYNSNVILFFERLVNKVASVDVVSGKERKFDVGMKMKITTIKNRAYVENQTVVVNLDYIEGINPYSGLLELAIKAGILENKPRGYLVAATGKTVYDKDLYTPEIFTQEALEKINEWLKKNDYSSVSSVFSSDVASAINKVGVTNEEDSEET